MKKTKTALLHSGLALLLCISMLIGSTFAWFSDSVSGGKNVITAGNLDLEMYWTDDLNGEWHNVEENGYNTIFSYDNWEPGYTDVKYIKLVNAGDLALNYKLSLTPQNGVGKLAEVINVYYAEGGVAVEQRDDLKNLQAIGLLNNVLNGGATADGTLLAADQYSPLHPSGEVVMTVAMNMLTTAGNDYMNEDAGLFSIIAIATQAQFEKDSFGDDYDADAQFPNVLVSGSASASVTPVDNKVPAGGVTLSGSRISAYVPEGVVLEDGTTELNLTVTPLKKSASDITAVNNEMLIPVDVHIDGVSENNTVPIVIDLGEILPKYLNMGNYHLYHVEDGTNNEMVLVGDKANLTAHNQYTYDPITGAVSVAMASFSEITLFANTTNGWNGSFDYSFNGNGTKDSPFIIATADELAGFGARVGGMNDQTQDSFTGEYVKLISDINLNGGSVFNDGTKVIFYPIGYNNDRGSYDKYTEGSVSSGVYSFEGTFDGDGHTISNFYQNTWEMFGDYNSGYPVNSNHYKDAMGLFGYVLNGTVKNLTVDHFESDGEFTPTGAIAAFADNSTFENIAITNCTPRVYNTGNGGIVGIAGEADTDVQQNLVFNNITVDKTNTITALWGSWDVACGGIVGMYRGDTADTISFTNCHVAAQIDVFNDVCGNYQYYWYRYSGMIIGTIFNMKEDGGYTVPDLTGVSATGCTVRFDEWNDYYYCELVDNSLASYTHDHQFSRLVEVKAVVGTTITPLEGTAFTVPATGRYNYVVVTDKETPSTEEAKCYHFVDGVQHSHESKGKETVGGNEVLVEDKQHYYLPFNQLFTGYGWGVKHVPIVGDPGEYLEGYDNLDIKILDRVGSSEVKFESKFTGDFLYRVGNQNTVSIGSLFEENGEVAVVDSGVWVTVEKIDENMNVGGTFTADKSNWTNGKIQFTGTGVVKVTIQDYNYCTPTVLYLEVVEATNITSATAGTDKNFVLLKDVDYTGTYLYYKNSTLYGNGFTMDITGADHSDLSNPSDTNSNKSAYCNIWMVDSRFDNIRIEGSVYPKVGMTADSDYGNAAIRTEGDCYITNSYVSNCRVPLRVQGNTTLIDTVVDGGRYANIELRSGKLTLDGVTTINTVRKGSDGTTDVIGFGIVIHDEAANASIDVVGDGLKQYNWAGENKHKSILSGDTYLSNAYKLIFNANNSDSIYFDYDSDRFVNTGVLCLSADITTDAVTGLDDRYCQEVSGYDAWVLTYDNSKHTAWFNESIEVENVAGVPSQYPVIPKYTGNQAQTFEFTKGETYDFDTSVLTAQKFGQNLTVSSVVMNGTTYNYGDKITFNDGGTFEVVYTVVDPYNYNKDASSSTTVNHNVSITITAIVKDAEILAPKFKFFDQNGNEYESTTVKAGDKTYVMPDVTAADPTTNSMDSINIGSATISGTTVYFPIAIGKTVRNGSNFNRYYPLFNGINITDYTIAGDTTGTTYDTSGNYTSLVGSSGTKFIIPANGGQTNCGDYVKTDGQSGNAAGNSDSGWQGAGYSTSYSGTYLKSGNTNASSGADENGYERIVWVEYCFNAGNGDVYYYRIGYHCNKEAAQTTCVTAGTLITLADGTQKPVEEINIGDMVLAFNHETGKFVPTPVIFNTHVDTLEPAEYEVLNLEFSNGKELEIVASHGLFDMTLMKYVYIDYDNYNEFIGHEFYYAGADGKSSEKVALVKAYVETEFTRVFCPVTYFNMNSIANGFLNAPNSPYGIAGPVNYFDYDPDLKYNEEAMKRDIEEYGLYTYDDFREYMSEEAFNSSTAVYLKIAEAKNLITYEEIIIVINYLLEGSLIK